MLLVVYMQYSFTCTCQILYTVSPVSLVNHQFEIGPRMDRAYEKHVNYLKFLKLFLSACDGFASHLGNSDNNVDLLLATQTI